MNHIQPQSQRLQLSSVARPGVPRTARLQPKLTVNRPGDCYEQEAERVADAVMRTAESRSLPPSVTASPQAIQANGEGQEIQRVATEGGPAVAPAIVGEVLTSPGQPLAAETRNFMEPRFRRDFSRIRVHTDTKAAESAKAVSALAFAVGDDIVFGAGQFAPTTRPGLSLLAHELTHTIQQGERRSHPYFLSRKTEATDDWIGGGGRFDGAGASGSWGEATIDDSQPIVCWADPEAPLGMRWAPFDEMIVVSGPSSGTATSDNKPMPREANHSVEAPGFKEGLIPIWGSGREAINAFQTGHWAWGIVHTGLAVSDVFLVKSLITAAGKVLVKAGTKAIVREGGAIAAKEAAELLPQDLKALTELETLGPKAVDKPIADAAKAADTAGELVAKGLPATTDASVADKLQRYILNPAHPQGGPKAKWFEQALGFTKENGADLAKQIKFDPAKAVQTDVTQFGTKFNQVIEIVGTNGKRIEVTFAWIRNNDGVVRLVTGIPTP